MAYGGSADLYMQLDDQDSFIIPSGCDHKRRKNIGSYHLLKTRYENNIT